MKDEAIEDPWRYRPWIALWSLWLQILASPGQTYGASVFVDPMIADLGVSRSWMSALYLLSTFGGALAVGEMGRLLDREGLRPVTVWTVLIFSLSLLGLSFVHGVVSIFLGFLGIRAMGQGMMGVISTNAVAVWYREGRGEVMGRTSAIAAILAAGWPPMVGWLIAGWGWRVAWGVLAALTAVVLLPIALLGMRDPPDRGDYRGGELALRGWSLEEARRTGAWWLMVFGGAVLAGVFTAMGFHQISILGERGLSPLAAAANFTPQFLALAVSTWLTGRIVDRVEPRLLIAASLGSLTAATLLLVWLTPGWVAALYAVLMGISAGMWRVIGGAVYPRWFGLKHIGTLQGSAQRWFVTGSALGPLPFALAYEALGSYRAVLLACALLPAAGVLAACVITSPGSRTGLQGPNPEV